MKYITNMLMVCMLFAYVQADVVFENFEGYTDTNDMLSSTAEDKGYTFNISVNAGAELALETNDYYEGQQSLKAICNNTKRTYNAVEFHPSPYWDWSEYDKFIFYYKGDPENFHRDIRVRLYDKWTSSITLEETIEGATTVSEWTKAEFDLSGMPNADKDEIRIIQITMWGTSQTTPVVMLFDDFKVVKDVFDGDVAFEYPGTPDSMTLNFSLTDPNLTPVVLNYGTDELDSSVEIEGEQYNYGFSDTLTGLTPGRAYNYTLEAGDFTKSGMFNTEALALDTYILDNFEQYLDSADLNENSAINTPTYDGIPIVASLETENSYDGEKYVKFSGQVQPSYMMPAFNLLDSPIDVSSYDTFRIWYKGSENNDSNRDIRFIFRDSDNNTFLDVTADQYSHYNSWTYQDIPIDDSPEWADLGYIVFRVSKAYTSYVELSIDRVEAVRSTYLPADYNDDLAINFEDLVLLTQQWLLPDGTDLEDFSVLASGWLTDLVADEVFFDEIYVSSDGSGNGLSAETSANYKDPGVWQSVNEALENKSVTVWFIDGQYNSGGLRLDKIGNEDNTLYLKAQSPDGVIMNSGVSRMLGLYGCTNMHIDGFNFTGDITGYAFAVTASPAERGGVPSSNIVIDNCTFQDLESIIYGAFGVHYGSYDVVLKNSTFKRVGEASLAHMVYNAYDSYNITIEDCYFEDCAGSYVKLRANLDNCTINRCTFNTTGNYTNASSTRYIHIANHNSTDPGIELFATNYVFTNNEFNFNPSSSTRTGIQFSHGGYNPDGWNYLMTAQEGAILEGSDTSAKTSLLLNNCGIDASKITITGNTWNNVDVKAEFSSNAAYGAESAGWDSSADISDVFGLN